MTLPTHPGEPASAYQPGRGGSPQRMNALLHLARRPAGETVPAMALLLGLTDAEARHVLNKLRDDKRLASEKGADGLLVYFVPLARECLRGARPLQQVST